MPRLCTRSSGHFVLGIYRPGLGNNPIHFASLSAMSGCLAMVGVASGRSPWRYLFLLVRPSDWAAP
jgi:O-antigen ligase